MANSAALLVDEILPFQPMRQLAPGMACSRAMQEQLPRVLSVPFPLRLLFASQPAVMGKVLGIVYRAIATHLTRKAGYTTAHNPNAEPHRQQDCLTEGIDPTRPPTCGSRPGSGMAFFRPEPRSAGIDVSYCSCGLKFSVGSSERVSIDGILPHKWVG